MVSLFWKAGELIAKGVIAFADCGWVVAVMVLFSLQVHEKLIPIAIGMKKKEFFIIQNYEFKQLRIQNYGIYFMNFTNFMNFINSAPGTHTIILKSLCYLIKHIKPLSVYLHIYLTIIQSNEL